MDAVFTTAFKLASRWAAPALLAGFCAILAIKLLSGRISLSGLLSGVRRDGRSYFSYGRAQLLAASLFIMGQYVARTLQDPTRLPDISNVVVALFAGSAAIYAGEKASVMLFNRSDS